jgi:hypothetical protein
MLTPQSADPTKADINVRLTTAEELNALPVGARILSSTGESWAKQINSQWCQEQSRIGFPSYAQTLIEVDGPFLLLSASRADLFDLLRALAPQSAVTDGAGRTLVKGENGHWYGAGAPSGGWSMPDMSQTQIIVYRAEPGLRDT